MADMSSAGVTTPRPHSRAEDIYALMVGCTLIVLGLLLLKTAGLVTAGTAGIALLLSYTVHLPVGLLFTLVNLPFFLFAARAMSRTFAFKSFLVNILISLSSFVTARAIHIAWVHPAFAAVAGGTAIGMGILALARHGAGVGGTGVLALWLYRQRGWNAGLVSLAFDVVILTVSGLLLGAGGLIWSSCSVLAIHGILFTWHRPGRYTGY
ncbi:YitT family protein [Gluconacetobacter tumulisoli]|nr:YitT family protein [Gluconacetobacter tumulisoli]